MAYNQEAFDAECVALARALEVEARRQITPARVTVFTDAQAAIRRMVSEEPGPGQKYAIQARKWIRALQEARPDIVIEIRWCPAHEGVIGNEKADGWAKMSAEDPEAHGVEWLGHADRYGRRSMPPPRFRRRRQWAERRITAKKYRMPADQRQDGAVAGCPKRLAGRFYQLKNRDTVKCGRCPCKVQTQEHLFKNCPRWKLQQKTLWAEVRRDTGTGKTRFKIRDSSLLRASLFVTLYLYFPGFKWGQARRGQGELPRAACGLTEVGADGERGWNLHNLVMI
jgi:hypothetical protein